jgi:uncharacterized protein (TIGR00255 family)
MLKSMTGYGKSESVTDSGKISVEIRSVNHRYGEISVKLPRQFMPLEGEIKKRVSNRFKRGKIDVFINFEQLSGVAASPQVNLAMAKAYHEAFLALNHHLGIYEPVPASIIIAQKDVLISQESSPDMESVSEALFSTLADAMDSFGDMRSREGEALFTEIAGRIAIINELVETVAERTPAAVAANVGRLKERIVKLLADVQLDEMRFAQEAALIADRMEITEELVRLRSHFKQFDSLLNLDEPTGRKLDFLLQEMNREVNTIGSKANDAEIAAMVVELKSEMEKVREQIQNIE